MQRDFHIRAGVYLCHAAQELDLHNNFDFTGLDYAVQKRALTLHWHRSDREWVPAGTPPSASITFREVSEWRLLPRDRDLPFTEDDCLRGFGYWTDETWSDGVIEIAPGQPPEPHWLVGIAFMSGTTIVVRAVSADAHVAA